jgi:hypothetical protein
VLVGRRKSQRTARAVFEDESNDSEELKTNLSRSVQAHRVSRIPGGDFSEYIVMR